jgi:site-specific recombinase XerD
VFPGNDGGAVQELRGWFQRTVERTDVNDYTWHCHRQALASRLVMAGVNLRTVGESLGHKSPCNYLPIRASRARAV